MLLQKTLQNKTSNIARWNSLILFFIEDWHLESWHQSLLHAAQRKETAMPLRGVENSVRRCAQKVASLFFASLFLRGALPKAEIKSFFLPDWNVSQDCFCFAGRYGCVIWLIIIALKACMGGIRYLNILYKLIRLNMTKLDILYILAGSSCCVTTILYDSYLTAHISYLKSHCTYFLPTVGEKHSTTPLLATHGSIDPKNLHWPYQQLM